MKALKQTVALATFMVLLFSSVAQAQEKTDLNTVQKDPNYLGLNGPRFGVTQLFGETATNAKNNYGIGPVLTQIGWQFERRLFYGTGSMSGLVEFIPLIGGLEQGKFLPSANLLFGMRSKTGFEFGVGPNISPKGYGMVFAAGATLKTGGFYIPVNIAYVPGQNGGRVSILTGFNIQSSRE